MKILKRFLLATLPILFSPALFAQTQSTVTATVKDPNNTPCSFGTVTATLSPGGISPTVNGQTISGFAGPAGLDGTGFFSMTLYKNTSISPGGTTWVFQVNCNSGLPLPVGTGGQIAVPAPQSITADPTDLSSVISAALPLLTNITSGSGTGTVTTFSAGSLNPLFTTAVASANTTPALTFSFINAAADSIFGRFAAGSGAPAYGGGLVNCPGAVTYSTTTHSFGCNAVSPQAPGTPVNSVQFNSPLGTFAGSANFTYTTATGAIITATAAGDTAFTAITATSQTAPLGLFSDGVAYTGGGLVAMSSIGVGTSPIAGYNPVLAIDNKNDGATTNLHPNSCNIILESSLATTPYLGGLCIFPHSGQTLLDLFGVNNLSFPTNVQSVFLSPGAVSIESDTIATTIRMLSKAAGDGSGTLDSSFIQLSTQNLAGSKTFAIQEDGVGNQGGGIIGATIEDANFSGGVAQAIPMIHGTWTTTGGSNCLQAFSTREIITGTCGSGSGTVTSVSFTGGIVSVATSTTTPALTVAGTSGGIVCFTSTSTWASSGLLTADGILYGGGAGVCPSSTAAGTSGQVLTSNGAGVAPTFQNVTGTGTVTSVSFTGGIISVANPTTTPALTVAGTSGGIPCFTASSTWASSAALVANGLVYGGGAGVCPTSLATPTDSQTYLLTGTTGSAPAWALPGIPFDAQTTGPYAWPSTDREKLLTITNASAFSVTIAAANSTGFTNNYQSALFNLGAGLVTITPTTSTINGAATQIVPQNWIGYLYSDNSNYRMPVLPSITAFPNCVDTGGNHLNFTAATGAISCGTSGGGGSGTVTSVSFTGGLISVATSTTTPALTVAGTSGGIVCFTSTSTWASSALLTSNVLTKGGGAGACPTNSLFTDTGTTATYTGTGGVAAPTFTSTGTTAGFIDFPQGTTSAAVAPCNTATSICEQAPTSVTSYLVTKPGAGPANNSMVKSYTALSGSATTESFVHGSQSIVLTGSAYTNATTTFSNVSSTTNLAFTLDASTAYAGTCYIVYSASAATAGPKIQFTGPASPTAVLYSALFQLTATPTYADSAAATAFSTSETAGTAVTNGANLAVRIAFSVVNGVNAGTLQLQAAANGSGTVTIQPGSWCRMQ